MSLSRPLTPHELAAMYLFPGEYRSAAQGAIEFWRLLNEPRKKLVRRFVQQMREALKRKDYRR